MVAHEAWAQLIMTFLESFVKCMEPPLHGWELLQFGSHHYGMCLPDSDLDVQLQLSMLPVNIPGMTSTDVTVAIGEAIRKSQWAAVSGVSDSAINSSNSTW